MEGEEPTMSVSTNGMLVYGYIWGDDVDLLNPDGDEASDGREWVDVIAERRGIVSPWASFPPEIEALPYPKKNTATKVWAEENRAALDAYYAAKKAIEDEYGVEIDSHGSDGWAVPIVKVAGVGHTARRGYPVKLDPSALAVDPAWDEKLARFCADLGIDTSEAEGPGWFLTSWWG